MSGRIVAAGKTPPQTFVLVASNYGTLSPWSRVHRAGADRTESLCAPSAAKLKRIVVGVNAVMTVITVITTAAAY